MTIGVNNAIIVGTLGDNPKVREHNGNKITNISVAVNEKWAKPDGSKGEHTEWINVTMFGKLAEIGEKYLSKGSLVYIEGRMRQTKRETDAGTRYFFNVHANVLRMLNSKPKSTEPEGARNYQSNSDFGEDIPF